MLENASLLLQAAETADIGYRKRKQILIIVADEVIDAAQLKTEAAAVGIVADLVKAERAAVQQQIIENRRCRVNAAPVAAAVAAAKRQLVRLRQQQGIGGNRRLAQIDEIFRIAHIGVDSVIHKLMPQRIEGCPVFNAQKRKGVHR